MACAMHLWQERLPMVVMLGPGRPSIAALMAPTLDPGDQFWEIISAVSGMTVHVIQEAIVLTFFSCYNFTRFARFFEMANHNYRSQGKPCYDGIIVSLVFPFSLW